MPINIPTNRLYHGYKPSLYHIYEKYYRHDGNPLLWVNTPICMFACDYVRWGQKVLEGLDNHVFIRYEYERYADEETVQNDTHKWNAAKRVMKIVDSIREHGYAKGKYKHARHLILVKRGVDSPFGSDPEGFSLSSRKHRAAACVALGMDVIKVRIRKS